MEKAHQKLTKVWYLYIDSHAYILEIGKI